MQGAPLGDRERHSKPELEAVLKSADEQGWRVTRRKKYFQLWCPCPEKHHKTVKLSPSNPNYKRELLSFLRNHTCWKEAQ